MVGQLASPQPEFAHASSRQEEGAFMGTHGYDLTEIHRRVPPDAAFVFLKASQSVTGGPRYYREKLASARSRELVVGHYHFYSGNYPIDAQLANFADQADIRPGELITLYFEPDHDFHGGQSDVEYTEIKGEFLTRLKEAWPHNKVGLYARRDWWTRLDRDAGDFLWVADLSARPGRPRVDEPWLLHKYAGAEREHSFHSGPIDELRAFAAAPPLGLELASAVPPPSEWITLPGNGYVAAPAWQSGDDTRVTFRGVTVNVRTKRMLVEAEELLGFPFRLTQGSYNAGGVAASAGTHDGGGVADIAQSEPVIAGVLRACGFAAWQRFAHEGFAPHIHAVAVGDRDLSRSAAGQVEDFFAGLNGLAGKGRDTYRAVPLPLRPGSTPGAGPITPPPVVVTPSEDNEMFAPYDLNPNVTTIPLEPSFGGSMGWGALYFSFKVATGDNVNITAANVRIELQQDDGRWSLWEPNFTITSNDPRWWRKIEKGYCALRFYTNEPCRGYVTGRAT